MVCYNAYFLVHVAFSVVLVFVGFEDWWVFGLLCLMFVALIICLCFVWVFGLFVPCVGCCVWCVIAWVLGVCWLLCFVVLSAVVDSVVMILSLFTRWCYLRVVLVLVLLLFACVVLCFDGCLYFLWCVFIAWLLRFRFLDCALVWWPVWRWFWWFLGWFWRGASGVWVVSPWVRFVSCWVGCCLVMVLWWCFVSGLVFPGRFDSCGLLQYRFCDLGLTFGAAGLCVL